MTRISLIRKLACGTFLLACSASFAATPPNILLIYTDDLGYGDLGHYGHPVIQTPHLDQLAREGITLTQHYANSGLCSPSRAGLLTGRYPYRTGIKSWIPQDSGIFLRDAEITLAEVLRDVGYATALVGKWHLNSDLGSTAQPQPNDQGFDYFYGHNAFQIPTNRNPTNLFRNRKALPEQQGFTAQLFADEALNWLEKRDTDKPFFLMLSMAEPHTTIENPDAYNQMYGQFTRGEIKPIPSGLPQPLKSALVPRGPGEYYANITYMDAQIGRVLAYLNTAGLKDNTIVVFSSDNGPVTSQWINWWEVNAYGSTGGFRGRKHMLYEGGIRVPAIVRAPGRIAPGSSSDAVVLSSDFFVTLIQWAGGTVPADRPIDGIDVREVLEGHDMPDRTVFWALDAVSELEFVIRQGRWKLLLDRQGEPRELYDLEEDPLELFNVMGEQQKLVAALQAEFATIRKSIDADPLRPRAE